MCLASADGPSPQFRPDADAVWPPPTAHPPAWQVAQSCISIALLFSCYKKITKAIDSKILNYLYEDKCVKTQIVHSSLEALRWGLCLQPTMARLRRAGSCQWQSVLKGRPGLRSPPRAKGRSGSGRNAAFL